jgi:hypothetical protein
MQNAAHTGRPGRARAAVASPKTSDKPLITGRGGSRSAADSSVVAPISWAREGPNMLRAASSGERVAE